MEIQKLKGTGPDKVFILVKNIAGATLAAGSPAFYDTADDADGYAVSGSRTGQAFMFAGIPQAAIADDARGLVQAYGIGAALVIVTTSLATGDQLIYSASNVHLTNHIPVSVTSLVPLQTNPWNFVTAMSVVTSGISTAVSQPVFIRAL